VKGDTVTATDALFDEKPDMANIGIGIGFMAVKPAEVEE
jgi:hypothetical protein